MKAFLDPQYPHPDQLAQSALRWFAAGLFLVMLGFGLLLTERLVEYNNVIDALVPLVLGILCLIRGLDRRQIYWRLRPASKSDSTGSGLARK